MEALTKVQTLLKVNKNEYNSFGKYKYRTAEAIMHEVKPHLITFNLSLYFNDKAININDLIVIKSIAILKDNDCLLYTSPSPRDRTRSRMPSSA